MNGGGGYFEDNRIESNKKIGTSQQNTGQQRSKNDLVQTVTKEKRWRPRTKWRQVVKKMWEKKGLTLIEANSTVRNKIEWNTY